MMHAILYILTLIPDSVSSSMSCPSGSVVGPGNKCYLFVDAPDGITWTQAKRACAALNSKLASIHSMAENAYICQSDDEDFTWVGGVTDGTGWRWDDGSVFNFTNWNEGRLRFLCRSRDRREPML